ncbi:MAG: MerR family transcriptional regulator [Acidimicrobiaceae bacterium]|nr:MerR family transcriptional regulator [Acidimicrobiaceae bacterium]
MTSATAVNANPDRDTAESGALLGIGAAAARLGVSERALRYYQQLGLLTPSGRTPGGLRRYSAADLARVERIRELQTLLGFNLDEIKGVLDTEDRLAALREEYRSSRTGQARRHELLEEFLVLREQLRETVQAKIDQLLEFRADLDASIQRINDLLGKP